MKYNNPRLTSLPMAPDSFRLNEEVLVINKSPLHGMVKEKVKADLIEQLMV